MILSYKTMMKFAIGVMLLPMAVSGIAAVEVSDDNSRDRPRVADTKPADENKPATTAQSPEAASVQWSVLASGGGQADLGGLKLGTTIGQTAVGAVSLGDGRLISGFWQNFVTELEDCCIPTTVGDVNQSGEVDITDIQVMIDHQFLSLAPLVCIEEGDINFNLEVDITDLQIMIDYQYISLTDFPPCP